MTKKEYIELFKDLCAKEIVLTERKNQDYTGAGDNPFANFELIEKFPVRVSATQGVFVRLSDKFARLASFIERGELSVKDESVEDTLLDISVYSKIIIAMLRAQKAEKPFSVEAECQR